MTEPAHIKNPFPPYTWLNGRRYPVTDNGLTSDRGSNGRVFFFRVGSIRGLSWLEQKAGSQDTIKGDEQREEPE